MGRNPLFSPGNKKADRLSELMLMGIAGFFMGHYLSTGAFAPYIFVGFIAAALFALSALFFVLGIVADMLDRIRSNQERILYILKKSGMTR